MEKRNLYRNIIMKNYQSPSQFSKCPPSSYKNIHAKMESCADDFMIFIKIENDIIEDILFNGMGCAISTASLNIIATYLINMKVNDAICYIKYFIKYIKGENIYKDELKNLIVFQNIKKHLNRIKCGMLGPDFILDLLK